MRRSSTRAEPRSDAKKDKKGPSLKLPLPDPVTEQVILAAALVDNGVRRKLVGAISADFFFASGHPESWELVEELERRGLTYDAATAKQLMGAKVDVAYLDDLVAQRPHVAPDLQHHLNTLRWDQARVDAIRGPLGGLVEALADATSPPERVVALARATCEQLEGHGSLKHLRDPKKLIAAQSETMRSRREGHAVYPFGIEGFDRYADGPLQGQHRLVPGTMPGEMTVITGLPGSAKSTFTARIVVEQANQGRRVLVGAWEMGAGITLELCAAISLGVSRTLLITGGCTDDELDRMDAEMARLSEFVRFFDLPFDRGKSEDVKFKRQLNERRLDALQEYLTATAPDVAVFDLYRRALADFSPEAEELALTRQQAMFQELRCHGILVHQMTSKEVETRADKTPTRDALKGSSAWFEVPGNVFGVHREFLWKAVPDDTLRVVILKQRLGVYPLAVDFPWVADTASIGVGRCAEYVRPGSKEGVDGFLDGDQGVASTAAFKEQQKGGKGGGKRRRV